MIFTIPTIDANSYQHQLLVFTTLPLIEPERYICLVIKTTPHFVFSKESNLGNVAKYACQVTLIQSLLLLVCDDMQASALVRLDMVYARCKALFWDPL